MKTEDHDQKTPISFLSAKGILKLGLRSSPTLPTEQASHWGTKISTIVQVEASVALVRRRLVIITLEPVGAVGIPDAETALNLKLFRAKQNSKLNASGCRVESKEIR